MIVVLIAEDSMETRRHHARHPLCFGLLGSAFSARPSRLGLSFALMLLTLLCFLPAAQAQTTGQVKYFPRTGYESRMTGGIFQGSQDNTTWTTLYTVPSAPSDAYTTGTFTTNPTTFRYLRYLAPSGSYGNVAEIEFDSVSGGTATKLTGTAFGTAGSYNNDGFTFSKALDGSTSTYFDAPAPGSGDFVGIDRGAPVLTSIVVSPATASLNLNKTQAFTATAKDQYGAALATQPSFTWSVASGVGTVSASGVYSSGTAAGSASVKATSSSVSGTAAVTVTNAAPTVQAAASASPNPATGTTSALSVLGADDGGEAGLTYTWATTGTPPAAGTFSASGTNAAKNTTATFTKAGSYSVQVTIKDAGGLSVTSSVSVMVSQTLTSIVVSPNPVTLNTGGTQTFTASAKDQFGAALATQPVFTWSVASGGVGSITSGGVYSSGSSAGSATVTATSGTISGTAAVTVNASLSSVGDLSTYSTGSGRIALYWTPVPNAVGYNIYRGTSAGGEDYVHPVNGAALVNAASYSGSPMDLYSDTGLTNGSEYFYTVTAVYSSGQSQPSNEDSDIPDPVDVPWDTRNPGAILSAIRSDFSDDTNSIGSDPFSLRAVGPDGTIYDDNFSTAQPPDGVINAATAQLVRPDGSTQTLPNDNGELYIAPSSGSTPAQSPAAGTPTKQPNGPIRRVTTFPNYRGADGYFALPMASTNSQAAVAAKDAATIYLGVIGQKLAVDAGVVYSDTTGWGLEMLITGHVHGIVAQPDPNSTKAIIPEVKLVNYPYPANIRFSSGSTVRITYWAWSNIKKIAHQKLSLLVVDDLADGFAGALAGPASALGKQENVAAKRVHSIAQNRLGVTPTGSRMDSCAWDQGLVIAPGTSNILQVWNASITAEDLKYMGGNSSVTATEVSPYTAESNINIDINPPPH